MKPSPNRKLLEAWIDKYTSLPIAARDTDESLKREAYDVLSAFVDDAELMDFLKEYPSK